MTPEETRATAHRFFDLLRTGDLTSADDIVSSDYINHNPIPGQAPGREGFKAFVNRLHTIFPDLHIEIGAEALEEDRVFFRYQVTGTHEGEFMGVPASGKQIIWQAIMQAHVSEGMVKEIWLQWDRLAVLQQLGVVPVSG